MDPVSEEQDNPDKLVSIEGTKYLPVKMGKQHTSMEKQMLEKSRLNLVLWPIGPSTT